MLPADLDDEQRAQLAHEHPTDLDSSPSSPSSGVPSFFDPRRRPKSASRHRSRSTTEGSSSSHLLARLVSAEEEVREINAALVVTTERLEAESSRANAAERRALDYFHRLRIATDNRERAEQETARLREELKLYKLQLENAQKEIFRAQDIIDQVAAQRNEAEAEATRARTKARKLQEEKLVMLAREEGRRMGYREGLSIGRRIGFDEEHHDNEHVRDRDDGSTDEEPNDPRSRVQLRSSASIRLQPMRPESAPPVRTTDASMYAPPLPVRVHTPSHGHRTPSPPHGADEPETIHPIPIRPSPIIPTQPISVPPDGWIPRADSRTSYILVPPPHELQPPIPASPSFVADELQGSQSAPPPEPTPVPPPIRSRDYAYQTSVPPPAHRTHTSSIASRTSTQISQYDLVNKRPGSSLRNEIYVGRARSGSQPSRESMSRNEHRDRDRRLSSRTEAEDIAEQWRADSDGGTPPKNPARSATPSTVTHSHRPVQFYYRPREIVTPTPLGDVDADPRSRTPVPTEITTSQSPPVPDDPTSHPARIRSPLEHLRQRFRKRPSSNSSIPNIIVQSPSEPETAMSPSTTVAGQPELLSPEAANRPLPQDDPGQFQSHTQHQHPSYSQQSQPQHHHPPPPSAHRSGTPSTSWPAGFVPYPRQGAESTNPSDRDRRHARPNGDPYTRTYARPPDGYARARTQSATSTVRGVYETAPLPPGMMYPEPPVRPHTSHRRHKDRDRDWEWDRDRDRDRNRDRARELARAWDWEHERHKERDVERERARDRDRDRRRESERDYEHEHERNRDMVQDREDTGLDEELTRSPAPLARPISLFDSDEA